MLTSESDGYAVAPAVRRQVEGPIQQVLEGACTIGGWKPPLRCGLDVRALRLRGEALVVGGVELFVGAGAGEGHAGAAFGVEEERGAPAVEEFASGAAHGGVIGRDEGEAKFVFAGEDGGDFGVAADGVAIAGEVGAEGVEEVGHDAEVGADGGRGGIQEVGEGAAFGGSGGRRGDLRGGI